MKKTDVLELHYITPISNVPSILKKGILSNAQAQKVDHVSVASKDIQEKRAKKIVPGGRPLHEYVNLYICARNPMLFKLKEKHQELSVLRINTEVLNLPEVVVADRNASSGYVRFAPSPQGLAYVDRDMIFAERWTHPGNRIRYWEHVSIKCAEILVPDTVQAKYINGAYVSCEAAKTKLEGIGVNLAVQIDAHLFFQ